MYTHLAAGLLQGCPDPCSPPPSTPVPSPPALHGSTVPAAPVCLGPGSAGWRRCGGNRASAPWPGDVAAEGGDAHIHPAPQPPRHRDEPGTGAGHPLGDPSQGEGQRVRFGCLSVPPGLRYWVGFTGIPPPTPRTPSHPWLPVDAVMEQAAFTGPTPHPHPAPGTTFPFYNMVWP